MKIHYRIAASFGLLLLAGATTASAQNTKLAYINSQQILSSAPGRQAAETQFESEVVVFRQQLQRMEDSLRVMAQAFEREQAALSPTARTARLNRLQTTEATYQQRAGALNEQMQRRQAELVRPIMDQLNRVLDQIRSEDGYAIIFDVGSAGQSIVAADTTLNITPKVVARLAALGPPPPVAANPNAPAPRPGTPTSQPAGVTRPRQ